MAFAIGDRIQETSSTTGTGTFLLTGAVTGYQSFAVIGNTNTTYYTIADQSGTNWEVGIGTYYSSNVSLARTTILSSSNANAVVNFGAGTKTVFVTYPAEKAIYADSSNITTVTNLVSGNVSITGGTVSGINVSSSNVIITGGTINSTTQNASTYNNATITGGTLNNVVIGGTTAANGTFTNVNAVRYVATANIAANSSTGAISYGNLSYSDTNIFASYTANANSYVQKIIQNLSNGTVASVDFIVSNNLGNATAFYGNFGMNSGAFAGTGSFNTPNSVYVYSANADLAIGTTTANSIHFVVNSGATDAVTINSSNAVAFNGAYGTSGQFLSSGGNAAAPTWTSNVALAVANSSVVLNSTNATSNGTIGAGYNGFSVGPVTVANGISITVSANQRWLVL
jgi:hypothetical protein